MSEVKDLSFKFEEMYEFLDELVDLWGKKIAEDPVDEKLQWLVRMCTTATILKVKLQILEKDDGVGNK